MPRLDSTRYTFAFAALVCVVCAALVSVTAVLLQPRQKANARLYMEKNVLVAAGLVKPAQDVGLRDVERIFKADIRVRLVDLATGELVPEDGRDARDFDQRAARNDPATSRSAPVNEAGVKTTAESRHRLFRDARRQGGSARDPGRGARHVGDDLRLPRARPRRATRCAASPTTTTGRLRAWAARSAIPTGRRSGAAASGYDDQWNARITVIKGQAGPPETDPLHVDGLSGATITSNAITRLVRFWLSEDGYGRFLQGFRERGMA